MESTIHIDTTEMSPLIVGPDVAPNTSNTASSMEGVQQTEPHAIAESKATDKTFMRRLTVATVAGIAAVSSILTFGAEYFGHTAGGAAMDTINSRVAEEIPKIEQNITNKLSNNIFPNAVCSYANNHSFIPKSIRSKGMDCSTHHIKHGH